MLKLKNVVSQMRESDYQGLCAQFRATKADKYLMLLVHFRQDVLTDSDIAKSLGIGSGAYYTLKSRLHDKIQDFQLATILGAKEDILKRVDNIPQLLYDTPKDTSIAVLHKLEEDLLKYEMPLELTKVYSALKKLHIHTAKYYHYSQNYNKQVAYAMAIEKVEDIIADFFKYLGNYHISRDTSWLEYLIVIKDQIINYSKLYQSHHMRLYHNMVNVAFALFVPIAEKIRNDAPIEDMLDDIQRIISEHDNNSSYKFLRKIHSLLSFEYYHSLKLHKKAAKYFEEINSELPSLFLYNFFTFNGHFLRSKIEYYTVLEMKHKMYEENKKLAEAYTPDPEDIPNYISYMKYLAIGSLFAEKYFDTINTLNTLMNTVSMRICGHAEIEIKLFQAYCYSIVNNYETALGLIKSALRKVREIDKNNQYANAFVFARILALLNDKQTKRVDEKITVLSQKFQLFNQGTTRMLEYLTVTEDRLIQMNRGAKKAKLTQ